MSENLYSVQIKYEACIDPEAAKKILKPIFRTEEDRQKYFATLGGSDLDSAISWLENGGKTVFMAKEMHDLLVEKREEIGNIVKTTHEKLIEHKESVEASKNKDSSSPKTVLTTPILTSKTPVPPTESLKTNTITATPAKSEFISEPENMEDLVDRVQSQVPEGYKLYYNPKNKQVLFSGNGQTLRFTQKNQDPANLINWMRDMQEKMDTSSPSKNSKVTTLEDSIAPSNPKKKTELPKNIDSPKDTPIVLDKDGYIVQNWESYTGTVENFRLNSSTLYSGPVVKWKPSGPGGLLIAQNTFIGKGDFTDFYDWIGTKEYLPKNGIIQQGEFRNEKLWSGKIFSNSTFLEEYKNGEKVLTSAEMKKELSGIVLPQGVKIKDIKDEGSGKFSFYIHDTKTDAKSEKITITQDDLHTGKEWEVKFSTTFLFGAFTDKVKQFRVILGNNKQIKIDNVYS